ncbi:hypothetical protein HYALB_00001287 [Hymenoscyphus albidus]|uniref:Uncharacterized protein n=1 Tax=Hymenoscyphus albidus TaxID=595503 RepID=A0A9N9LHJ4_9HELO|nr:hypothetical protein HYALB_00001287 [Hymenoscyphus albidus]
MSTNYNTRWAWESKDPQAHHDAALKALSAGTTLTTAAKQYKKVHKKVEKEVDSDVDSDMDSVGEVEASTSTTDLSVFRPLQWKPAVSRKRPTSGWVSLSHSSSSHKDGEDSVLAESEAPKTSSWMEVAQLPDVPLQDSHPQEKNNSFTSSSPAPAFRRWGNSRLHLKPRGGA